jgi:hypothetical protein
VAAPLLDIWSGQLLVSQKTVTLDELHDRLPGGGAFP